MPANRPVSLGRWRSSRLPGAGIRQAESCARDSPASRRHSRRASGTPHAIALSILADGIVAMTAGEWKKALTLSEQALAILRDQCVGVTWELNIAQNLVIWALHVPGRTR